MGAVSTAERRRPWEEKNPVVAGVLAYLVPGAGHFYQGRWFKGWIYFICILGAYFGGMRLGEGAVVYQGGPIGSGLKGVTLTFLAQSGIGLPSLAAVYQARRANDPNNQPVYELTEPLNASFQGRLVTTGVSRDKDLGELEGTVSVETRRDMNLPETRGTFKGTLDGKPIELALGGGLALDRPVSGGFYRKLECHVARTEAMNLQESQVIRGTVPRRLTDAFNAPPDPGTVQELHGRLGKFYDLAIALTMIAGLLNVLAVWDAVEGPAYGFGDEIPATEQSNQSPSAKATEPAAPATRG